MHNNQYKCRIHNCYDYSNNDSFYQIFDFISRETETVELEPLTSDGRSSTLPEAPVVKRLLRYKKIIFKFLYNEYAIYLC